MTQALENSEKEPPSDEGPMVDEEQIKLWLVLVSFNVFTQKVVTVREQQQQQPFNGRLSGTTQIGRYQKKHSPAHTHPGQRTSFITFLHLQRSMASSLFSLRAW